MVSVSAAARSALDRGAWREARSHLEASVNDGPNAEALEDLGLVGWWLDDAALTFDSRERAYALYSDAGDARSAARVAIWLVWDNLAFRGDFAVASGWMERARRLLADHTRTAEYGWLLIREAEVALFRGHDPAAAINSARRATMLGREIGDRAVEFTGLALEGLALVSSGDVAAGMRCLDEATVAATAGEVKELHAVGLVCCWQIFACERVRDYDRAAQWCARVKEFTKRWHLRPLTAVCRTQYAGVLIWRGDWDVAEEELTTAVRELEQSRPAMVAPALARLGELRMRQGRRDDAQRLFERAGSHPIARIGAARLMLDGGNPAQCVLLLEQFLEQVGSSEATIRAGALEVLVRAHAATGDAAAASRAFDELQRISTVLGSMALMASAAWAEGMICRQRGDLVAAVRCYGTAVDLFVQTGAPFDAAAAQLDLAETLVAAGKKDAAKREIRRALEGLQTLGAVGEEERATRLLRSVSSSGKRDETTASLTRRQVEILRLIAQGHNNPEIAERLELSQHTVKRHIANLLTRLGLSSRSAAVAYAARERLL